MDKEKRTDLSTPSRHHSAERDYTDMSLAETVRELELAAARDDGFTGTACRRAMDWLATLRSRLEDANRKLGAVKAVEFAAGCGDSDGRLVPGTEQVKIMMYNTDVVSDEDARGILDAGRQDLDGRVVVLWPQEACALFPGLREDAADGKHKEE